MATTISIMEALKESMILLLVFCTTLWWTISVCHAQGKNDNKEHSLATYYRLNYMYMHVCYTVLFIDSYGPTHDCIIHKLAHDHFAIRM